MFVISIWIQISDNQYNSCIFGKIHRTIVFEFPIEIIVFYRISLKKSGFKEADFFRRCKDTRFYGMRTFDKSDIY